MKDITIDLTAQVATNEPFRKRVVDMNEFELVRICRISPIEARAIKHQALIIELKESN